MRRTAFLFGSLLVSTSLIAGKELPDYPAQKLTQHVYVIHGPSGDISIAKPFRTYSKTVYDMASKLSDDGLADYEMKGKIAARLKPYWDWSGFEHEFGRHISLAVLEYEQAGF